MNKELEEVTIFLQEKIEELNRHIKNYEESNCKTAIYKQISEEKEVLDKALNYIDNSISKEEYNKIKEENEILKQEKRSRIIGKYGEIEVHHLIKQVLSKDFISKEVIKEKIEELKNMNVEGEVFTTAVNFAIKVLQELLEGK